MRPPKPTTPCQPWPGTKTDSTPIVYIRGKRHAMHRIAYQAKHGLIPDTTHVKHACGDCHCVAVDHLYTVDTTDPIAVFLDKTAPPTPEGCRLWIGATNNNGTCGVARHDGRSQSAHRVAWQLFYGPIPPGAQVRHNRGCTSPLCVNPLHLRTHKM